MGTGPGSSGGRLVTAPPQQKRSRTVVLRIVRRYPRRNLRQALRYWRPRRLTLRHNPRIHAWLWWNIATEAVRDA